MPLKSEGLKTFSSPTSAVFIFGSAETSLLQFNNYVSLGGTGRP